MDDSEIFPLSQRALAISEKREKKTIDIVRRLKVITPDRIHIQNFPYSPKVAFNPGMIVDGENVYLYVRIITGYYTYASAIAEIRMTIDDIYYAPNGHYSGHIVIFPDNKYDIWGTEDPRVVKMDGKLYMTYCGRPIYYFDSHKTIERTFPITAVKENKKWKKISIHRFPNNIRNKVISDKDSFLFKINGKIKLFHRPHMLGDRFYLTISDIENLGSEESIIKNTIIAMKEAKFESKIGWGTPPVEVYNRYILFLHGVERDSQAYKVFAIEIDKNLDVIAVTPFYIMAPKEIYEVYGDRPMTIFPCGAAKIDDKILISYGSADFAIGIGEIPIDELLNILDKGKIE